MSKTCFCFNRWSIWLGHVLTLWNLISTANTSIIVLSSAGFLSKNEVWYSVRWTLGPSFRVYLLHFQVKVLEKQFSTSLILQNWNNRSTLIGNLRIGKNHRIKLCQNYHSTSHRFQLNQGSKFHANVHPNLTIKYIFYASIPNFGTIFKHIIAIDVHINGHRKAASQMVLKSLFAQKARILGWLLKILK